VYIANLFLLTSDAWAPVVRDTELEVETADRYNLILLGSPLENTWVERYHEKVPLKYQDKAMTLGMFSLFGICFPYLWKHPVCQIWKRGISVVPWLSPVKFFWDRLCPFFKGLDNRLPPPPPLYLKVWIWHWRVLAKNKKAVGKMTISPECIVSFPDHVPQNRTFYFVVAVHHHACTCLAYERRRISGRRFSPPQIRLRLQAHTYFQQPMWKV